MTKNELREYCINPKYKVGEWKQYEHYVLIRNSFITRAFKWMQSHVTFKKPALSAKAEFSVYMKNNI